MLNTKHTALSLALVYALGGLAQAAHAQTPVPAVAPEQSPAAAAATAGAPAQATTASGASTNLNTATDAAAQEPRIIRGNDAVVAPPKPFAPLQGGNTGFRFEEAPIAEFAVLVLKDIVKADYVLHQQLTGSVTLSTGGDVSPDQAVLLLEAALQANGLVMARDTRGTYHIGKPEVIRGIVPAIRQAVPGNPLPPGSGAIVVRLQYIGAAEMATILRPMLGADSLVRVDNLRNLLVLAGTRTQAEGWLDLISTFDVNLLKGMSVGVFPLKHATVKEVEAALSLMTGSGVGAAVAAPSGAAAATTSNAAQQQNRPAAAAGGGGDANPLQGALRILPIERLNSILVVTPRAAYLDEARAWIERLDKPSSNSAEPQLFLYPVQNGSAKHLASVIGSLFGSGQTSTTPTSTGVAPALGTSTFGTSGFGASGFGTGNTAFGAGAAGLSGAGTTGFGAGFGGASGFGTTAQRNTPQGAQAGVTATTLGQGPNAVRMIADELNNMVVFYGTRAEFAKVEAALKRLDLPPTQVLIEASIIEVTLRDDLEYGLQWLFNGGAPGDLTGRGAISNVAGGVLGSAGRGFSYTMVNPAGNIRAVLNALATKSLVKVISSPSLMVLDNHTATISVGNQQPFKASSTIITGGGTSESIQYKDTGVSLQVTPSVTAGNMVTMALSQMVTDVGDIDSATGQRTFLQRQINSKVAVRSGESIVLGGLIQDNATNGGSGVPGLSAIPIIGGLFGTQSNNVRRTELLVVLLPRVVRADQDLREVSDELRDRMKGLTRKGSLF
ncbi:type II secretion system secretin GspD [Acidovorax lacteus]|uniref:Type IV pilus biogenesis and competence protein PilQ n=1 Tax=Acidovorax lacteus TaxID=1924988 RepID=A0ABP8L049_9BURK